MIKMHCCRVLLIALVALPAGCIRSSGNVELLEARLRDQQDLAFRYERLLSDAQEELRIARGEANQLRQQLAERGQPALLPEHADVLLRAEKLAFDKMMTGGRDTDDQPGDDVLHLVITPQDRDGETVKLIGELVITAEAPGPEGTLTPVGQWTIAPEEARENWHAGFLASGYQFEFPWQKLPQDEELVVHAQLKTADGRKLTATQVIKIDPPGHQNVVTVGNSETSSEPRLLPPLSRERELGDHQKDHSHVPSAQHSGANLPAQMSSQTSSRFLDSLDALSVPRTPSGRLLSPLKPSRGQHSRTSGSEQAQVPAPQELPKTFPRNPSPQPERTSPSDSKESIAPAGGARPFPASKTLRESTNWTEQEIPVVR